MECLFECGYAALVAAYLPPGWPAGVHPPDSAEFQQTAVAWLLDVVPPDYRLHGVLVRHPMALATLASHHLAACVAGARDGYRTARAELGRDLPAGAVEAVLGAYRSEGERLVAAQRAADLITRALRGEAFVPQLSGKQAGRRRVAAQPDRPGPGRQGSRASRAGQSQPEPDGLARPGIGDAPR